MTESLALALQSTTLNQPRAHIYGLSSYSEEAARLQARLPTLVDVREDAEQALKLLKQPPPTTSRGFDLNGEDLGILHPAVAYILMLPRLTTFAYLCLEEDVPDDLQELCVWALKQRFEAVKNGPERQLRCLLRNAGTGIVQPYAKDLMEFQTLSKLSNHLLSTRMNRPAEAVPYLEACLKAEEKLNPSTKDPFSRNPCSYLALGAALARAKSRNGEAKAILERVINDIDQVPASDAKKLHIKAKLYLSRVLRRIGELEEAKRHETYLITWFRKNPDLIGNTTQREWFLTENADDPVFEGLGGLQWLEKQKTTWKSVDRSARSCFKCLLPEGPSKKMLRCAKCEYTFYCSRECQREDYPSHKVTCRELAEARERAQKVKSVSAEGGKCMEDWNKYMVYNFSHNASIHALGLKHNPVRGLSHIVIRSAKHVPNGGKDVVDRFVIVAAGVFAISDIWAEIDSLMGYDPGESKQVIGELIQNFYDGVGRDGSRVITFDLLISDDKRLPAYLSTGSVPRERLAGTNHNPQWRNLLNLAKNVKVEQLVLKCGVKDAEFDYYVDPQTAASQKSLADLD